MRKGLPQLNVESIALSGIVPVEKFFGKEEPLVNEIDRTSWKDEYEISGMSVPQVADFPSIRKKFKIHLSIYDQKTKKTFHKTLFFGQEDDFIFTKDRISRLKKLSLLKNANNPLHGDYWRAHICYAGQDFEENVMKVISHFLRYQQEKLGSLRPKIDYTPSIQKRVATMQKKGK